MLPNPYLRPREPQYFAYPGAHHLLYHLPTTQLFTPTPAQQQRAPTRETNTSAIHPYTPYRAHDSALSTPSLPRSLQDNLLRRKTPAGILPASYDAAPSQWPSRPAKHILLPLITETGELQHVPDVKHIPTDGAGSSIKHGTTLIDNDLGRLMKSTHGTPISHLNSSAWIGAQLPPQRQQKLARPSGQQSFMVTQQQPASPHGGEPVPSNATNNPLVQAVYQPVFVSWQPNELTVAYMPDGAGVGYYLPNGLGSTPQRAPIINPTIPQLTPDSVYQINNSSIAPADVQHAAPMYMITPGWDQAPRRNSGQPQAYRTIDAVVTSPNPLPLQHPIVADPVHHQVISEGVQGLPPIQQQFTQSAASVRSRVMTWAHGVYTDLVQSLQANQSTPNVVHVVSQQPTPNDTPLPADRLHQLNHLGTTLSQYPPNRDRRKRRRIDDIPEHGEHYFQHNSGCPTNSGYPSPQVHRTELKKENNDYHNISFSFTGYESPLATPNQQSPEFQVVDPLGGYSQVTNLGGVGDQIGGRSGRLVNPSAKNSTALQALDSLHLLCVESGWRWLDGMLLGGCIAYALNDLTKALTWFFKIIEIDSRHVEALSNIGATYLALNKRADAEKYWLMAIKARPSYFEAVEHLVALLCGDQRGADAVPLIEFVEKSIRRRNSNNFNNDRPMSLSPNSSECSRTISQASSPEMRFDYYEDPDIPLIPAPAPNQEFLISPADNGRLLGLIHAKGNMLYTLGDNAGAAKAFEDAVLVAAGRGKSGIKGLIRRILDVISAGTDAASYSTTARGRGALTPILLTPDRALQTARLVFPPNGELPCLAEIPPGPSKRLAISTTSNSLLSLAKIFQDGISSGAGATGNSGVRDILALYYLSLSLHPSPSTANNVGILLASVQQVIPVSGLQGSQRCIPGNPGTGVNLALMYYQYGLSLDARHAHLYTNLGSLLKDTNNLPLAIKMYEQAVQCDGTFDIALANLANAVKDQGRTNEAIKYYRRAVAVSPNFAEAVCGLANALNSVCDWKGRGGIVNEGGNRDRWHVSDDGALIDARAPDTVSSGWMNRVVSIVQKQLKEGESWGKGVLVGGVVDVLVRDVENAIGSPWPEEKRIALRKIVEGWNGKRNAGMKLVRLLERTVRRTVWRWYQEKYIHGCEKPINSYLRPTVPAGLSTPTAPTVLPFHTFTCPLSAQQVRMISQRNGIRISCSTLRAPWLSAHVTPPPAPPSPHLNVGYVSSDFNNHPLAHLMQSVFGLHDITRVKAHCYATTPSDGSSHRHQIERESPVFYDASSWGPDRLIQQIIDDGIHILVNLNGFTRGARNEIFAARPAPIQMSFMGFAGTLGADWCDYLLADSTAVPPETLRPWRRNVDIEDEGHEDEETGADSEWVYAENIVFTKYSFFCCDHRQSAPDAAGPRLTWNEEQQRRWAMRKEIFPDLPDDAVILGNFNQLYKIEPTTFRTWLRIIRKVPNARLWLLRFPDLGEKNLRELAEKWAGSEVAKRIIFTDVAPKQQHIARARVCDVFLDTPECNAHTTAADVTWSGTPLLTLPRHKYKMCSRIAASILRAAVPQTVKGRRIADSLIATSEEHYEQRAVELALNLKYEDGSGFGKGELVDIRKVLYEGRWTSPLFDTRRWVRDLEDAYGIAWRRWENAEGGDIWL